MSYVAYEKPHGGCLTTDFILRYHSYDRGATLPAYAFDFPASVLKDLNPRQVNRWSPPCIEATTSGNGGGLAQQAISYVPGTECVDIVLDDLVEGGHEWAWRMLEDPDKPAEIAQRLAALIDQGSKKYTIWGQEECASHPEEGRLFCGNMHRESDRPSGGPGNRSGQKGRKRFR